MPAAPAVTNGTHVERVVRSEPSVSVPGTSVEKSMRPPGPDGAASCVTVKSGVMTELTACAVLVVPFWPRSTGPQIVPPAARTSTCSASICAGNGRTSKLGDAVTGKDESPAVMPAVSAMVMSGLLAVHGSLETLGRWADQTIRADGRPPPEKHRFRLGRSRMHDRRDDLIASTAHHASHVAPGHGLIAGAVRVLAAHPTWTLMPSRKSTARMMSSPKSHHTHVGALLIV